MYNVCSGIYVHTGDGLCSGVSNMGLVVSMYSRYVQLNCTRTYIYGCGMCIDYIWSYISKVYLGSMCTAVLIG